MLGAGRRYADMSMALDCITATGSLEVSMKLLKSGLNSLGVGGCCAAVLVFLGVNLDKRPWWSWLVAAIAFGVIWEFAKAGIAKSVADRMGLGEGAD